MDLDTASYLDDTEGPNLITGVLVLTEAEGDTTCGLDPPQLALEVEGKGHEPRSTWPLGDKASSQLAGTPVPQPQRSKFCQQPE